MPSGIVETVSSPIALNIIGFAFLVVSGLLELRKMRVRLNEKAAEFQAEKERLTAADKERDDLWRDVLTTNDTNWQEFSRRQVELLQKEIERGRRANEQLTQDVTRALELRAEAETRVSEQDSRIKDRDKRIDQLLAKLDEARKEMLDIARADALSQGQVTELKRQLDNQQLALNKLQRDISALAEEKRDLKAQRDAKIAENEKLQTELSARESKEKVLLDRISILEAAVNELVEENNALKNRVEELTRRVDADHKKENDDVQPEDKDMEISVVDTPVGITGESSTGPGAGGG